MLNQKNNNIAFIKIVVKLCFLNLFNSINPKKSRKKSRNLFERKCSVLKIQTV